MHIGICIELRLILVEKNLLINSLNAGTEKYTIEIRCEVFVFILVSIILYFPVRVRN